MTGPMEGHPAPSDEVVGEVTDMVVGEYYVLLTEWPEADLDVVVYPVRNGATALFSSRVQITGGARADAHVAARAHLQKIGWDIVGDIVGEEWEQVGTGWKATVRRIP